MPLAATKKLQKARKRILRETIFPLGVRKRYHGARKMPLAATKKLQKARKRILREAIFPLGVRKRYL